MKDYKTLRWRSGRAGAGLLQAVAAAFLLLAAVSTYAAPVAPSGGPRTLLLRCTVLDAYRFRETAEAKNWDIWRVTRNGTVDVRLPPEQAAVADSISVEKCLVLDSALSNEPLTTLMTGPAEGPMRSERSGSPKATTWTMGTFFTEYRRFDVIVEYLRQLGSNLPAGINGNIFSVGQSLNGRELWVLRLAGSGGPSTKKQVWLSGGWHAREWVAPTTVLYMAASAIAVYPTDPTVLDSFEFFFAPCLNPDGYEYTHTNDRLWRKNLRNGYGVDLNRNFPYDWGKSPGSSPNTGSETYRGTTPLSEPESLNVHNFIMTLPRRFVMIDIHSYGQLLLRAWGTSVSAPSSKETVLKALSDSIVSAIKSNTSATYEAQKGNEFYPVSGGFDDWGSSVGFSAFTLELRDTGSDGFVLPASEIVPTGRDGWAALKALVAFANSAAGTDLGPQSSVPNDGTYITNGLPLSTVWPTTTTRTTSTSRTKSSSTRTSSTTVRTSTTLTPNKEQSSGDDEIIGGQLDAPKIFHTDSNHLKAQEEDDDEKEENNNTANTAAKDNFQEKDNHTEEKDDDTEEAAGLMVAVNLEPGREIF